MQQVETIKVLKKGWSAVYVTNQTKRWLLIRNRPAEVRRSK